MAGICRGRGRTARSISKTLSSIASTDFFSPGDGAMHKYPKVPSAITVTMLSSRFAYLSLVLCAVRFVNASNPAPPSPQLLRRHLHQPASSLTCLTTPRSGALTISSNSTSPTQSSQHQSFGAAIITGPASHPMPYIVRIRLQEALPQSGC